jgi:CTP:molybdopterin cytidylyltransferase MocA
VSRPVAIILASGKGERVGGPKALLAWSPRRAGPPQPELPLAIAHAEARLGAECGRALVVARKPVVAALLRHMRPGLELLRSEADDALGPAGSLAVAAARIGDAEEVIVTPVDALPARADTVAQLLARLRSGEGDAAPLAVRPRHKGRGGHPVVLRAAALARYLQPDPPILRDHLRSLGDRCVDEEVDDATVLIDLDTPGDVMRATGAPVRFLS